MYLHLWIYIDQRVYRYVYIQIHRRIYIISTEKCICNIFTYVYIFIYSWVGHGGGGQPRCWVGR